MVQVAVARIVSKDTLSRWGVKIMACSSATAFLRVGLAAMIALERCCS